MATAKDRANCSHWLSVASPIFFLPVENLSYSRSNLVLQFSMTQNQMVTFQPSHFPADANNLGS